jgi:methenyltetrahydromethanopterin cyclohydrolase
MIVNMNESALKVVKEMASRAENLGVKVYKASCGATVIDGGVKARGSVMAGLYVTRICMGDLAEVSITSMDYAGLTLPVIHVSTDYPSIATCGSQLADWEIKVGKYYAMASGPARALALERSLPRGVALKKELYEKSGYCILSPRQVYEKINYSELAEVAVIVLEASSLPPDDVLTYIAKECSVKPNDVYAIVTPTSSITGSVQIAGRIVEVGIHKLALLGFDLTKIIFGSGHSPIASIHPEPAKAMGRVNDAIRYAGATFYMVDYEDEEGLRKMVEQAPSSNSKDYHKPFAKIFKEAKYDFYSIDLGAFAPAVITVNNVRKGTVLTVGKIDPSMLRRALAA